MINEYKVKRFCREYWNIENYQQAVNDLTQTWDCHHRREISENKSRTQLIDEGRYYDVNPSELIFLTRNEHISLHNKCRQFSLETRKKMSEAHNGKSVMCIETGEVFYSVSEAARKYNLCKGHISKCCNGKLKTTGRFHWKYV